MQSACEVSEAEHFSKVFAHLNENSFPRARSGATVQADMICKTFIRKKNKEEKVLSLDQRLL